MNSICILFLLIGIAGSRPASIRIKPLPPVEEVNAAIVEPLPPPPQLPPDQQNPEPQNDQEQPDTPQVVVVTLDDSDHQLLRPDHRQPAGAQRDCAGPAGGPAEAAGGSPA